MKETVKFYLQHSEPVRGSLLALKQMILSHDKEVTEDWKYGMPFFCFRGKMFCYLWYHKKHKQPYLGIVEGSLFDEPYLIQEKRSRMKIMLIDPTKNLPISRLKKVLNKSLAFYRNKNSN